MGHDITIYCSRNKYIDMSETNNLDASITEEKRCVKGSFRYSGDYFIEGGLEGLKESAVMHDRKWSYNRDDWTSLVTTDIRFDAKCTFITKGESTKRELRIVDDLGNVHGVLEVDIEARAPCVNAKPQPIEAKFVNRQVRKSNFSARPAAAKRDTVSSSSSSSSSSSDSQVPHKNTTL